MKIYGYKTELIEVEITEEDRIQLVRDFLKEKFKLESAEGGRTYIKDGKLVDEWEEDSGGRGRDWTETRIVRRATKRDHIVLKLLEEIK